MLTEMDLIPHSHFGMSGGVREHTLIYTVVIAGLLTIFFDLSRIASLGAFFYLVMDITIHWGVFRHMKEKVEAKGWILLTAIGLDAVVLVAFGTLKLKNDPTIVFIAAGIMIAVFGFEYFYLRQTSNNSMGTNMAPIITRITTDDWRNSLSRYWP